MAAVVLGVNTKKWDTIPFSPGSSITSGDWSFLLGSCSFFMHYIGGLHVDTWLLSAIKQLLHVIFYIPLSILRTYCGIFCICQIKQLPAFELPCTYVDMSRFSALPIWSHTLSSTFISPTNHVTSAATPLRKPCSRNWDRPPTNDPGTLPRDVCAACRRYWSRTRNSVQAAALPTLHHQSIFLNLDLD